MSREIKFRFWDRVHQCWLNPDEAMVYGNGAVAWDGQWVTGEVDVVRFTGLTDKNGKEIFEGDVVNISAPEWEYQSYTRQEVFMDARGWYPWTDVTDEIGASYLASDNPKDIEVIGNIYESPELLKE